MQSSVLITTWNVATKCPKEIDLDIKPTTDFVVFGFQELISQFTYVKPSQHTYWFPVRYGDLHIQGLEPWIKIIGRILVGYSPVYACRRAALGLLIFKKQGITITGIKSGSIGTGLFGLYGNKGCVACVLEYDKKSVGFLNCHMGPHQGEYYYIWRKQELDHILKCIRVRDVLLEETAEVLYSSTDGFYNPTHAQVCFLFGDFNFRLRGSKPNWGSGNSGYELLPTKETMTKLISQKDIQGLLQLDEILYLKEQEMIGFEEARITFMPSYKLNKDQTYSNKRQPAYCDRILFTSRNGKVTNKSYEKLEHDFSDHHPVLGSFVIEFEQDCKGWINSGSCIAARLERFWYINQFKIGILVVVLGLWFFIN